MNKKSNKENNNSKIVNALISGIAIGFIIGSLTVYSVMKYSSNKKENEYNNEKLSITEKLSEEITKLTLKNDTYTVVDNIEKRTSSYLEDKKINSGSYIIKNNSLIEIDPETLKEIKKGTKIEKVDFTNKVPTADSMVVLNEKGKISEGVFYIDGYQITYDLVGTKVTKVEE